VKIPSKISARAGGSATIPASMWNELIDYLRSTRISPSVGVRPIVTSQGTVLVAPKQRASSGVASKIRPWDIINLTGIGDPDENGKYSNYEGNVWPGLVGRIMPSNVFSSGELTKFNVPSTLTKWKAKCRTDGVQITSVEILVDASDPPATTLIPSALPTETQFVFGVTYEGAVYRTLGEGNPSVTLNQAVTTDKTNSPPPGVPGVDRWYQIIIS
jgi:hypothetical protein